MPKNTSVTIGAHFDAFIAGQIRSGRFHSASEVIRAALRLLEEEELKLQNLRMSLAEAEASEVVQDFDMEKFLQGKRAESL